MLKCRNFLSNKLLAVKGIIVFSRIIGFFKKNKNDLGCTKELWELLKSEQYEEVTKSAERLLSHKSINVVKDAAKLMGNSYFRQAKYEESLPYFQTATNHNAEINDWFNVITAATLSKNIKVGRNAFEQVIKIKRQTEDQLSLPMIYQYYACALRDVGENKLALEQINNLREIYEQLKITDSTFLYMRGVPFLSHTMDVAVDVFKGLGTTFDADSWIDNFSGKVDEEGQEYLKEVKAKIYS